MFESKVYNCQSCSEFFFFEHDAKDHTEKTGHADFVIKDWQSREQPSPRINRTKSIN
ncbi:MAG TPA: hypothetical protein VJP79_03320 [Nitrososphaera sp.]|nr:hypothetical protein [Nitrososphaera sp.]